MCINSQWIPSGEQTSIIRTAVNTLRAEDDISKFLRKPTQNQKLLLFLGFTSHRFWPGVSVGSFQMPAQLSQHRLHLYDGWEPVSLQSLQLSQCGPYPQASGGPQFRCSLLNCLCMDLAHVLVGVKFNFSLLNCAGMDLAQASWELSSCSLLSLSAIFEWGKGRKKQCWPSNSP